MSRDDAFKEFVDCRREVLHSIETNDFDDLFDKYLNAAAEGDEVKQDVVAYYYKSGVDDWLDEDYKKYLAWEILAGANGNEFAIEKLQFYLGYAYDIIIDDPNFGIIKYQNSISGQNYQSVLGKKICEEVVKKMGLDAKQLADEDDDYRPYAPEILREFRLAVDEVLPKVIAELQ